MGGDTLRSVVPSCTIPAVSSYTLFFFIIPGGRHDRPCHHLHFFSLSWGEARSIGRVNRYTFPSELSPPRLTFVRLDEHLRGTICRVIIYTIGRVIIYTFIFSLSLGEARSAVPIETYFFFNTLGGDTIGRVIVYTFFFHFPWGEARSAVSVIYTFFLFFLNGGRHDRPCQSSHNIYIFFSMGVGTIGRVSHHITFFFSGEARSAVSVIT